MLKINLFDELKEDELVSVPCDVREIKPLFIANLNESEDDRADLIILFQDKKCVVYMKKQAGKERIEVSPAIRIRMETGFDCLERDLLRIDRVLAEQKIVVGKYKFCRIRKVDFVNDFVIADFYAAML